MTGSRLTHENAGRVLDTLRTSAEQATHWQVIEPDPADAPEGGCSLERFIHSLMPHQREFLRWMLIDCPATRLIQPWPETRKPRYGGCLFAEQGTGKTRVGVAWMVNEIFLARQGDRPHGRMLLVMSENCKAAWLSELQTASTLSGAEFRVCFVESTDLDREVVEGADICIITQYMLSESWRRCRDVLGARDKRFQATKRGRNTPRRTRLRPLDRYLWERDLFAARVVDEAHFLRNGGRSDFAPSLAAVETEALWLLTGTPIHTNMERNMGSLFLLLGVSASTLRGNFREVKAQLTRRKTMAELRREHPDIDLLQVCELERNLLLADFLHEGERALYGKLHEQTLAAASAIAEKPRSARAATDPGQIAFNHKILAMRQLCASPRALADGADLRNDGSIGQDLLARLKGDPAYSTHCTKMSMAMAYIHRYCRQGSPPEDAPTLEAFGQFYGTEGPVDDGADPAPGEDQYDAVVVFSQWTRVLAVLGAALREAGVPYCRYEGSMSKQDRNEQRHRAMTDPQVRVFLISIEAGSTSLNLQGKFNRVLFLEPNYNPQLELQALKRVHRMGDAPDGRTWLTPKVVVTWLLIRGTVEARIYQLGREREEDADNVLGGGVGRSIRIDAARFVEDFSASRLNAAEHRLRAGLGRQSAPRYSMFQTEDEEDDGMRFHEVHMSTKRRRTEEAAPVWGPVAIPEHQRRTTGVVHEEDQRVKRADQEKRLAEAKGQQNAALLGFLRTLAPRAAAALPLLTLALHVPAGRPPGPPTLLNVGPSATGTRYRLAPTAAANTRFVDFDSLHVLRSAMRDSGLFAGSLLITSTEAQLAREMHAALADEDPPFHFIRIRANARLIALDASILQPV